MMSSLAECRWALLSLRSIAVGFVVLWSCLVVRFASGTQPPLPTPELPAELSAAARDFRIEIYGAFRQNRVEYDTRRKQGEKLLADWQTRGALLDEAAALARWFDEARRATTQQQPLPPAPNWNSLPPDTLPIPQPPPRGLNLPASSEVPILRAVPFTRLRNVRQVQITASSTERLFPSPNSETGELFSVDAKHSYPYIAAELPAQLLALPRILGSTQADPLARTTVNKITLAAPAPETATVAVALPPTHPGNQSSTSEEKAELNTAELRARIRGYDKAWRALQIDLYAEEELTFERADTLLTILRDLGQARRDLLLYQAIAPAGLREELQELAALDELQKQLRHMIDAVRARTAADQSLTQQQRAARERAWDKLLENNK